MKEPNSIILEQISLFYDINISTEYLSHISTQIDDSNTELRKLSSIISPDTSPDFSFRLREVKNHD